MRVNRRLMLVFADLGPKLLFKQGEVTGTEAVKKAATPGRSFVYFVLLKTTTFFS